MTTLLVITTGQSDVQLALNGERHELEPKKCGLLHDEIVKRTWTVVDSPKVKKERKDRLPGADLTLCTPKLDAVLAWFGDQLPSAAIIFDTRREMPSDPRLAGRVLEQRLKKHGISADCCTFLIGRERLEAQLLEDRSNEIDAIVRRDIVKKLDSAISQMLNEAKFDRIVIAATGGLAAVNEVVEALVRLHAVGKAQVTSLEVPDGAFAAQDDHAVEEKFHPAAGYRARWHALSLVEKGNLLGAWGAVNHLEGAPGQEWAQVIKWLAHFASSLPLPTGCDLAVLSHHRMAVRAALRVELALRAGDIPRAVHGTVAVFEAGLWDKLGERIERSSDPTRRRYFRVKSGDAPTEDKLLRTGDGSDEDRKRPFEKRDSVGGVDWYWIHDGDGGPAARLAKYYIQSDALTKFDAALGSSIRELRNDIAHNEPTPELMNEARTRMQSAALWSNNDTFLSQPLVQAVLKELGEQCPEQLCINFVLTVRERLLVIS